MTYRPHPFLNVALGNTVVMLNPFSPLFRRLRELRDIGDPEFNPTKMIMSGLIAIGNTPVALQAPPGVMCVNCSLK